MVVGSLLWTALYDKFYGGWDSIISCRMDDHIVNATHTAFLVGSFNTKRGKILFQLLTASRDNFLSDVAGLNLK